jgi:hypothetical protein
MTASTLVAAGDARAADSVDRLSSRPDFAVLGYPVISMTESWTHQGSLVGFGARRMSDRRGSPRALSIGDCVAMMPITGSPLAAGASTPT